MRKYRSASLPEVGVGPLSERMRYLGATKVVYTMSWQSNRTLRLVVRQTCAGEPGMMRILHMYGVERLHTEQALASQHS